MNLEGLLDTGSDVRVAFRPISTDARRALARELVPSKPEGMLVPQFVLEMTAQLRTALKDKDEWYTRLIRYKSIDQVDEAFFDDLIHVLGEWAQQQESKTSPAPVAPQAPQAPQVVPTAVIPAVVPVALPVVPEPQGASQDTGAVQVLRDVLVDALRPTQSVTPWALTAALNDIFQSHGVRAKAQVVPASLTKISTSMGPKTRHMVAVVVGEGFTPMQVDLRHFPGLGWYDPLGLGSPAKSAKSILSHVIEQMFC